MVCMQSLQALCIVKLVLIRFGVKSHALSKDREAFVNEKSAL